MVTAISGYLRSTPAMAGNRFGWPASSIGRRTSRVFVANDTKRPAATFATPRHPMPPIVPRAGATVKSLPSDPAATIGPLIVAWLPDALLRRCESGGGALFLPKEWGSALRFRRWIWIPPR